MISRSLISLTGTSRSRNVGYYVQIPATQFDTPFSGTSGLRGAGFRKLLSECISVACMRRSERVVYQFHISLPANQFDVATAGPGAIRRATCNW